MNRFTVSQRRRLPLFPVFLGLLIFTACGSDSSSSLGPGTTTPTTLQVPTTQGGGDIVGNGGGGVCVADKCTTLAEAGVRIPSPEEAYVLISPQTIKTMRELIDRLPVGSFRRNLLASTLGEGENFIQLEILDAAKIEKIRQQYANLLKQSNSDIQMKDVQIFAFGVMETNPMLPGKFYPTDKTFLLPEFFQLAPDQQAKILIHEHNVRGRFHNSFMEAVELDGLMDDLWKQPSLFLQKSFRMDRWTELLGKFYFSDVLQDELDLGNWLAWNQSVNGWTFDVRLVCKPGSYSCYLDPERIQENYQITPSFLRFLKDQGSLSLSISWDTYIKDEAMTRRFDQFCASVGGPEDAYFFHPFKKDQSTDYHIAVVHCYRSGDGPSGSGTWTY